MDTRWRKRVRVHEGRWKWGLEAVKAEEGQRNGRADEERVDGVVEGRKEGRERGGDT